MKRADLMVISPELIEAARTGEAPEGVELEEFDFYSRAWNRVAERRFSDRNVKHGCCFVRKGADLWEIISTGIACGAVGVGASDTGVYEIQGPAGIWKHYRSRRIDREDVGTDRVIFLSWEEMEAIELAGGVPFAEVVEPWVEELAAAA